MSRAALPIGVPCCERPRRDSTRDLLVDNQASTPGCSTRTGLCFVLGPLSVVLSNVSQLPVHDTTDHGQRTIPAEAVGLEPGTDQPGRAGWSATLWPPVVETGSSSGRMASVGELRGLESNQRLPGQSRASRPAATSPHRMSFEDTACLHQVGEKDSNLHLLLQRTGSSPVDERAVAGAHRRRRVGREALESSSPGLQPGACSVSATDPNKKARCRS